MTITIDLDPSLEKELESLVETEGVNVSLLVQQFLEGLVQEKRQPSAWELGQDLFGKYGSGQGNLAKDRKKILREKIHAKHRSN
jgi:hypothetical protein